MPRPRLKSTARTIWSELELRRVGLFLKALLLGLLPRGCDGGSGATGMMVTVRVADFGRSPFEPAAGEENFGPKGRFP